VLRSDARDALIRAADLRSATMTRLLLACLLPPIVALAACSDEPENIQAKADNLARTLENKAVALEAEASNDVEAAAAPLDNEADALLNQAANAAQDAGNAAENVTR
jgi:hypothetical protein